MFHVQHIELIENVADYGPRCSLRAQMGVTHCGHAGFQLIFDGMVAGYVCKEGVES